VRLALVQPGDRPTQVSSFTISRRRDCRCRPRPRIWRPSSSSFGEHASNRQASRSPVDLHPPRVCPVCPCIASLHRPTDGTLGCHCRPPIPSRAPHGSANHCAGRQHRAIPHTTVQCIACRCEALQNTASRIDAADILTRVSLQENAGFRPPEPWLRCIRQPVPRITIHRHGNAQHASPTCLSDACQDLAGIRVVVMHQQAVSRPHRVRVHHGPCDGDNRCRLLRHSRG